MVGAAKPMVQCVIWRLICEARSARFGRPVVIILARHQPDTLIRNLAEAAYSAGGCLWSAVSSFMPR